MSLLTTNTIIDRIERGSPSSNEEVALSSSQEADLMAAWQQIINYKLIEWGRNPAQFDDEDTDGPTPQSLQSGYMLACQLRDHHVRLPNWVVPSGAGGITLSWGEHGKEIDCLEIDSLGKTTFIRMKSSQIVEREDVDLSQAT